MTSNEPVLFYRFKQDDSLLVAAMEGKSSAVTIGNFDGLHLGHQQMIRELVSKARARSLKAVAISFDPRPDEFFSLNHKKKIFNFEQKKKALLSLGVDLVLIIRFDQDFADLSAQAFFRSFLLERLSCKEIFVGPNFRFGRKKEGNAFWLKKICEEEGTGLSISAPLLLEQQLISSSWIRQSLEEKGDVKEAAKLLGRPFLLEGLVIKGLGNGSKLGFPTANLDLGCQTMPLSGVYGGLGGVFDWPYLGPSPFAFSDFKSKRELFLPCLVNCGIRPSFDVGHKKVLEVHFPKGVCGDLYGKGVFVFLLERLRDEKKFASLEDLQKQIRFDLSWAEKITP